jgi:hypothetical protein
MIKPNFFIVGKPKSGTTALHLMLEQHPDLKSSKSLTGIFNSSAI